MAHWAKPGVKCVCVDDAWIGIELYERMGDVVPSRLPMINEVLTITAVMDDLSHCPGVPTATIALVFSDLGHDWGFAANHFRPLTTTSQEDDVALFRHLLEPTGVNA